MGGTHGNAFPVVAPVSGVQEEIWRIRTAYLIHFAK